MSRVLNWDGQKVKLLNARFLYIVLQQPTARFGKADPSPWPLYLLQHGFLFKPPRLMTPLWKWCNTSRPPLTQCSLSHTHTHCLSCTNSLQLAHKKAGRPLKGGRNPHQPCLLEETNNATSLVCASTTAFHARKISFTRVFFYYEPKWAE